MSPGYYFPVCENPRHFRKVFRVAIISFVCSVGNIPLAAVLWHGGISFGGVLAFILADLIVLPILNIYRKYYGLKMAPFLLGRVDGCRKI
jgi:uncharacterized membrane protein YraQ (UPF0718 family)